MLNYLIIAYKK